MHASVCACVAMPAERARASRAHMLIARLTVRTHTCASRVNDVLCICENYVITQNCALMSAHKYCHRADDEVMMFRRHVRLISIIGTISRAGGAIRLKFRRVINARFRSGDSDSRGISASEIDFDWAEYGWNTFPFCVCCNCAIERER